MLDSFEFGLREHIKNQPNIIKNKSDSDSDQDELTFSYPETDQNNIS